MAETALAMGNNGERTPKRGSRTRETKHKDNYVQSKFGLLNSLKK